MQKKQLIKVAGLIVIVGSVCFGGGYMLAGGQQKVEEQYTYGENIMVNIEIQDLEIDKQAQLYKGMTPFDALLEVASLKTEYYPNRDASIITEIGGISQSWGYEVNGETPTVGMQSYQLRDGDNLKLYKLEW